ncbi:MAG: DUF4421 family protein [Chitinophagaceae bacterium]|nr:DUF4421 family protein [Chitinophagaceae bacterium]
MKRKFIQASFFIVFLIFRNSSFCQEVNDSIINSGKEKLPISSYIEKYDTLIHFEPWLSTKLMEYRLYYPNNFKLFLRPVELNTLSLGLYYRFIDLSIGFSPKFINQNKPDYLTNLSKRFEFTTGFSFDRFYVSLDYSEIKGFYLRNTADFGRSLPEQPNLTFPELKVKQYGAMINYNFNPRFSRSGMKSGAQSQLKSAWTFMPAFQYARYRFSDKGISANLENDNTFSADLNLLFPLYGTLVIGKHSFISGGFGPSVGLDFYRSLSYTENQTIVTSKGTSISTGYLVDFAMGINGRKFYGGLQGYIRSYGHKIEEVDKMQKVFYSGHLYVGMRFNAPKWTKKTLDWVNKISPIKFE